MGHPLSHLRESWANKVRIAKNRPPKTFQAVPRPLAHRAISAATSPTELKAILAQGEKQLFDWKQAVDVGGSAIAEGMGEMLGAPPGISSTIFQAGVELVDQLFPEVFSSQPMGGRNAAIGAQPDGALPAAYADLFTNEEPSVRTHVEGEDMVTTVRHSELISDLLSVAGEQILGIDLNPGLDASFPWLSGIAQEFQSYSFKGLDYLYAPEDGTDTAGSFVSGVMADSTAPAPEDEQAIASLSHGVAAGINRPISMTVSDSQTDVIGPAKFVRDSYTPSEDRRTSDSGKLVIKLDSAGVPLGEPIGYLSAAYECEFRNPVGTEGQVIGTSSDLHQLLLDVAGTGTVLASTQDYQFPNISSIASPVFSAITLQNPIGSKFDQDGLLFCPKGWYKVRLNLSGLLANNGDLVEFYDTSSFQTPTGWKNLDTMKLVDFEAPDVPVAANNLPVTYTGRMTMNSESYAVGMIGSNYHSGAWSEYHLYFDGKSSKFLCRVKFICSAITGTQVWTLTTPTFVTVEAL
jgi:hypothetical protein